MTILPYNLLFAFHYIVNSKSNLIIFRDLLVELRLLRHWNFFDADILPLPKQLNNGCGSLSAVNGPPFPVFYVHPGDSLNLTLGGLTLDWTFAVAFAPVFIFPRIHTGIKIPRWIFYLFYPAHLLVIVVLCLALGV